MRLVKAPIEVVSDWNGLLGGLWGSSAGSPRQADATRYEGQWAAELDGAAAGSTF
jgi:hypothetical protein